MVKLSLTILSAATLFVAASAAPYCGQQEHHPFQLWNYDLKTFLSKHINSDLLVGGFPGGNKYFQQLQFCIVSTDAECTTDIPTDCIHEDVEYRFRVNSPVVGYLQIDDEQLQIVPDFEKGSSLTLYVDKDHGLRIVHPNPDGSRSVFETTTFGRAVVLAESEFDNDKQWFDLIF
ncbi:hypothetical protein BG005_004618 [Podila minutissima]|nr:hypothetical protein BG005_004618 [Podila minutissima]